MRDYSPLVYSVEKCPVVFIKLVHCFRCFALKDLRFERKLLLLLLMVVVGVLRVLFKPFFDHLAKDQQP